jgi:hypothetical protein
VTKAKPSSRSAKRSVGTTPAAPAPVSEGAGMLTKLVPPSLVRRIEVHLPVRQGTLPSTQ